MNELTRENKVDDIKSSGDKISTKWSIGVSLSATINL